MTGPPATLAAAALIVAMLSAAAGQPITVETRGVGLDGENPGRDRVGALRFRGGLELTSENPRFGGLSALGVSADGARMVALTDRGDRFAARLRYDAAGRLAGLGATDLGPLAGIDGRVLEGKRNSDAEAMAPGVAGDIVVAFERRHRLLRYLPGRATPEPLPLPLELARAPRNGGIEALALLADGSLLALTEDFGRAGARLGWLSHAGGWSVLTYAAEHGYKPTGAATLPDGDVVVIERRLTLLGFFRARLIRLAAAHIVPGARLQPRLVAALDQPLAVDNFEGVAARRGGAGETLIYLISDDNFRDAQRTLLMMFELVE
jgi:hypothetical protein